MPVKVLILRLGHADHLGDNIPGKGQTIALEIVKTIPEIVQGQVLARPGGNTGVDTGARGIILDTGTFLDL